MLQVIRDKTKGWFAWVFVILIASVFIIMGMDGIFNTGGEQVIAKVNKDKITQRDWDTLYESVARVQGPMSKDESEQLRISVLSHLIDSYLFKQKSSQMGVYISDDQVRRQIISIPSFQVDGQFSREKYQEALNRSLLKDSDLKDEVRNQLALHQMRTGIVDSSFALKSDLMAMVKYVDQKRAFDYVIVPKEQFETQVVVKDEMVQDYYDSLKEIFKVPEMVQVEYVDASLAAIMNTIEPTDEEMLEYFEENQNRFLSPEMIRASHIIVSFDKEDAAARATAMETLAVIESKLAAGDSFESLAKQYSQDPISAKDGGDLDWFARGHMVPEFEKAAFDLEIGQVSKPVESNFGIHLIKKTDAKKQNKPDFEDAKADVEQLLVRQMAEDKLFTHLEDASMIIFENPNSLEPAAQLLGLEVQVSDYFNRTGGLGLFASPAVIKAAFSDSVKEEGLNSDLIQINGESFLLLRVKNVQPEKIMAFDEVKDQIRESMIATQTNELTRGLAKDILNSLKSGETQKSQAKLHRVEFSKQGLMSRSEPESEVPFEIQQSAFSIPRVTEEHPVQGSVVQMKSGDFATVVLSDVQDGSLVDLTDDRLEVFMTGLSKSFGEEDFDRIIYEYIQHSEISHPLDSNPFDG